MDPELLAEMYFDRGVFSSERVVVAFLVALVKPVSLSPMNAARQRSERASVKTYSLDCYIEPK